MVHLRDTRETRCSFKSKSLLDLGKDTIVENLKSFGFIFLMFDILDSIETKIQSCILSE